VSDSFSQAFARVPDLLAAHVLLAASALALGLVISLPLAIWSARTPSVARVTLGIASLVQTIPSLALLALFYPLLLSLSALAGGEIPALGFLPSLLALSLYALLPIRRGMRQAAMALGLRARERLWLVELPLATPAILAGIKTSAVINVGTATIAAFIGAGGYGERIAAGLALNDNVTLLAGAVPAAALALIVQGLFELVESRVAWPARLARAEKRAAAPR